METSRQNTVRNILMHAYAVCFFLFLSCMCSVYVYISYIRVNIRIHRVNKFEQKSSWYIDYFTGSGGCLYVPMYLSTTKRWNSFLHMFHPTYVADEFHPG